MDDDQQSPHPALSGNADLAVPLKGELGHGVLFVTARKSAGQWNYETLEVEVEESPERIDLLHR